jgi:hypothetical protein
MAVTSKNPLFYERVVPLDRDAHRSLTLDRGFDFARDANLIPAVIDEFGAAIAHLPIAFLPGAKRPAAVFVVGLNPGRNLFLKPDGTWDGRYVPAYVRRYPFIVGDVPGGEPLLCIDESYRGFGGATGERLFSDSGEPQAVVSQALDLAVNYKRSADRTDEFCAMLQEMGLLGSVSFNARTAGGENTVVHGLFVVDEAAFDALGDDDVRKLHRQGFLKPILQHLASLAAISHLADRSGAPLKAPPASEGQAEPAKSSAPGPSES